MAKQVKLDTRSARLRLEPRKKPYTNRIAPGIRLAYRRNAGPGTWSVLGDGGKWLKKLDGVVADDVEDADGTHVLDYWQAVETARDIARAKDGDTGKLVTVDAALTAYEADLCARGANPYNAAHVRFHLTKALLTKTAGLLTANELRRWRDGLLAKGLKPATVSRTARMLKAALTLAANHDPRISNRDAWRNGLAGLPDGEAARNVILTDDQVRDVITGAQAEGPEFATLVEVAAVTGARVSQIARLEVGDVQADRDDPRVMMPSSRKGRRKRITRRPVPIPADLARRLRLIGKGRAAHALLLLRANGQPWRHGNHRESFQRVVARLELGPEVTLGALRHSSIVRSLLAGVPTRVAAAIHDTSTVMIERAYSKHIADHADVVARRGLLDAAQPSVSNVVPLTA